MRLERMEVVLRPECYLPEVVRSVPGFPSYGVTADGVVHSKWMFRPLAVHESRIGYKWVWLQDETGRRVHRYLHRLVALAWVENPMGLSEINHRDLDKGNNRAGNLEWCTHGENLRHARAAKDWGGNLTRDQVSDVIRRFAAGEHHKAIAAELGCHPQSVIYHVRVARAAGLLKARPRWKRSWAGPTHRLPSAEESYAASLQA